MKGIIYLVTNKVTGHKYVGQTTQLLAVRWQQHLGTNYTLPPTSALDKAIKQYGEAAFTVEQIDSSTSNFWLDAQERHWIKFYDACNPEKGYNVLEARTAITSERAVAAQTECTPAQRARQRNNHKSRKTEVLVPVERPTVLRWHSLPAHMRRESSV